jgi:hypothetical protein
MSELFVGGRIGLNATVPSPYTDDKIRTKFSNFSIFCLTRALPLHNL